MSINDLNKDDDCFSERETEQIYIGLDESLKPTTIKTVNKGLRAFIFYRNLDSLKQKDSIKDRPFKIIAITPKGN